MQAGALFAQLSLDITGFKSNLKQAAVAAKAFSAQMQQDLAGTKVLGEKPFIGAQTAKTRDAIRGLKSETAKAGKAMSESLGEEPQKALRDTESATKRVTWTMRGYIKDTARVVTGILISQTAYMFIRAIRTMAKEAFSLAQEFERMAISFKYLLREGEAVVNTYLNRVRQWAIATEFSIAQVNKVFNDLIFTGIKLSELDGVLYLLAGAASVLNRELDDLAGTFLQIQTATVVSSSELRRLQRELIPVGRILKEQLGLTEEEFKDIAGLQIPGEVMFRALIAGMEEFGDAAFEASKTAKALASDLKETFRDLAGILGSNMFERWRSFLERTLTIAVSLRKSIQEVGTIGLLGLFPPALREEIALIRAGLIGIWATIKDLGTAFNHFFGFIIRDAIYILSRILPAIAHFGRILVGLTKQVTFLAPLFRVLAGAIALLGIANIITGILRALLVILVKFGIIKIVSMLFTTLAKAFSLGWKFGLLFLGALVALFALITMNADRIRGVLDAVNKKIMETFGTFSDTGKIDIGDAADDAAEEWYDFADAIDSAAEALKPFLASFDEVYNIPDQTKDIARDWSKFSDLIKIPEIDVPDIAVDEFDIFGTALDAISIDWKQTWEDLKESAKKILRDLWDWYKKQVAWSMNKMKEDWLGAWEWLKEQVGIIWNNIKEFIKNNPVPLFWLLGLDWLNEKVKEFIERAKEFIEKNPIPLVWVFGAIAKTVKEFIDKVKEFIDKNPVPLFWVFGWHDLNERVRKFIDLVKIFVRANPVPLFWFFGWDDLNERVRKFIDLVKIFVRTNPVPLFWFFDWHNLGERVKKFIDLVKIFVRANPFPLFWLLDADDDAVSDLWENLKEGWEGEKEKLSTSFDLTKDALADLWSILKEGWVDIRQNLTVFFGLAREALSSLWSLLKGEWNKDNEDEKLDIWFKLGEGAVDLYWSFVQHDWNMKKWYLDVFLTTAGRAFPMLRDNIKKSWEAMGFVLDILLGLGADAINTLRDNIKKSWEAMGFVLNVILGADWNVIRTFRDNIKKSWEAMGFVLLMVLGVGAGAIGTLWANITRLWTTMGYVLRLNLSFVHGALSGLWERIKNYFANLRLDFPAFKDPKLPKISFEMETNRWGVPQLIPKVRWNKFGGIYNDPSIIGVGEAGKEAVVPLTGDALKPFADAVANALERHQGGQAPGSQPTVYVHTLIADEQGLRELERRMRIVRLEEDERGGLA